MAALTGSLDTLREALACLKQDDQDQPAEGALLVPCGDLIRAANAAEVIQAARCPVCQHKVTDYITPELLDVAARVAFCAQGAAASSSTRVNYLNEHGLAPIHEAVIRGDMTRLKDLLGTPGIDLDVRSSDKKTALVHALTNRQVPLEAARELIHAGAAVTEMTLRGTTVLTLVFLNDAEELWEPVVARLREHPKTLREDVEQALQKIGSQYDSTGTSVSPSQLEMTRKLVALYLETGEPDEDVLTHASTPLPLESVACPPPFGRLP